VVGGIEARWLLKSASDVISLIVDMALSSAPMLGLLDCGPRK
jgi:hypothetical protein